MGQNLKAFGQDLKGWDRIRKSGTGLERVGQNWKVWERIVKRMGQHLPGQIVKGRD